MKQTNLLVKFFISAGAVILLIMLWRIAPNFRSNQSDIEVVAESLLPDSGQSLQLGAHLSAEAVEIGEFVTLTVVLRNNESTPIEPKIAIQLPDSLRLEETQLTASLLFNTAEHTLYWYPMVEAEGGLAVEELRLLALLPTDEAHGEPIAIQLFHDEKTQALTLPIWSVVSLEPTAVFEVSDQQAGIDQQILFTNLSAGLPPLSYHWDFGDGRSATTANPYHTYSQPGEYFATLTVSNQLGQTSHTMPITIGDAPRVRIMTEEIIYATTPFTAQAFADSNDAILIWDMGDGTELSGFWVEHTYTQPGQYLVTLNVTNAYGNAIVSEYVMVEESALRPTAVGQPIDQTLAHTQPSATPDLRYVDIQLESIPEIDVLPLPDQLLGYVNEARRQVNLPPLTWSYQLSRAAKFHTDDAAFGYANGHIGGNGSTPYDRVAQANYVEGYLIGEATAWGFNSALSAVQFWLDSPEHRALILSLEADQAGVAESTNYDTNYVWYWTIEIASYELPTTAVVYTGGGIPTPLPTLPATATATLTPTATVSATATITATLTPSPTPTTTPTGVPTARVPLTPTATITPTLTPSPTPTATPENTPTPEQTPTPTPSETPSETPTETSTSTPTSTASMTSDKSMKTSSQKVLKWNVTHENLLGRLVLEENLYDA